MQRTRALLCILAAACWNLAVASADESIATGIVFNDVNRNGVRDAGEPGLPDVRVSNGRDITLTASDGSYSLPVGDDTIIFMIKPRDWMTPVNEQNLPQFYYVHKPAGSPQQKYPGVAPTGPLPESIDFALYRRPEPDRFKVIVFGDTQPENTEQVNYLAHDVIEEVIGADTGAAFGISLGDLVSDRLDLFGQVNEVIALVGIPFYNVPGNHDMDHSSVDNEHWDEAFERVYGPPYYAFDYGPVHFVVLRNLIYEGRDHRPGWCGYHGGLGEQQLEFVRNDLAGVPKDRLVVLTMHAPIMQIEERKELYQIMAAHPHTLSFSAHTHTQAQWFLGSEHGWPGDEPHHHINCGTVCGAWWSGAPDELGIPHATMSCGAPNGWLLATFEGHDYSVAFKAARRPADYQMNIHAPEVVTAAEAGETEVLANVFAGSERSVVEMRVGEGEWAPMEQVQREDPYYLAILQAQESEHRPRGRKLGGAVKSRHIWRATLPEGLAAGTHVIEVRTTDMFGQTYHGRRIVRVAGS
jgi:hypothetical protein